MLNLEVGQIYTKDYKYTVEILKIEGDLVCVGIVKSNKLRSITHSVEECISNLTRHNYVLLTDLTRELV